MILFKRKYGILYLPAGLASEGGLLLGREGETSVGPFFSAVRTFDKAATAAALCEA